MGDPHEQPAPPLERENVLPDVVRSPQIPVVGNAVAEISDADLEADHTNSQQQASHNVDISETESISEHVPSKIEYSNTDSDSVKDLQIQPEAGDNEKQTALKNIILSPNTDNVMLSESHQNYSWPMESDPSPDIHPLSEESPVILASSDLSKEAETIDNKSQEPASSLSHQSLKDSPRQEQEQDSPKQENSYIDSLNEEASKESNISIGQEDSLKSSESDKLESEKSSGSEDIIKLDIRGRGVPKFPLQAAKIIFGPPPEGSNVIPPDIEPIPVFQNLLSPFLVGVGDMKLEEVFADDAEMPYKDPSLERSPSPPKELSSEAQEDFLNQSFSSDKVEQDLLVEEVTVENFNETKERTEMPVRDVSLHTQPKSIPADETTSLSTMTTDYKTICEEYNEKLVHLEDAITKRDELIEELTISLQQSVKEQNDLRAENKHLTNEVQSLQHRIAEQSLSDHDTVKAQLSDFIKYENMLKDDSTKFYSAIMSGGSSIRSSNSNGEKDNDREEITVNYSRSDLRSGSDDFQAGIEDKLAEIIDNFDEQIEENLRNKLRESIIEVLCNEITKMRIDYDTELRQVETQLQQEKQVYTIETRKLRELLASVKAGNADIDALREELNIKHEKEMENLRTYFEKKCSDMERSYSEEVWRGKACASPAGSASSLDAPDAAGDYYRRRTRSAELPSLTLEPTQLEQALKQASKKYEQQIEELKTEQAALVNELQARHKETVGALEEQIMQLKAHIQTADNTESNVSLYQQDIDLELEKKTMTAEFEARLEEVRQEVAQQLQDQIQVLLSDPDAEVASWPAELVALRDKIHETRSLHDKEASSIREECGAGGCAGEADKWRQRRNLSFDQNRQLEQVTKERDGLKRVAVTLQRVVSQLVAYCACAEDELNRTVLDRLLARVNGQHDQSSNLHLDEDSRPSTPVLDVSVSLGKHVHFAPHLPSILHELDEEGLAGFLAEQRDISADIKKELENSLLRLRNEAHDLLDLSAKLSARRSDAKMLESGSQVQITELVHQLDQREHCDNCQLHRKNMEEAMAECLQREGLLRGDLDAAMMRIAHLVGSAGGAEYAGGADLVAEGYGTVGAVSLPARVYRGRGVGGGGGGGGAAEALSLDGGSSPRAHLSRMQHDVDSLQRERDDLHQQLEAANRQLRSTRQFVEEQATEREAERDEFARRLAELREENARLATRLQNNARILSEVEQLEAQTREMNQIIHELESRKAATDEELKSHEEKITLLRDIIQNLETQLEQKTVNENEVLKELEHMKNTIEERDRKMRSLVAELESARSERGDMSEVMCVKCGEDEDRYQTLLEQVAEQSRWLEEKIHRSTQKLERVHEVASASCSEPSEDVSLRDRGDAHETPTAEEPPSPRVDQLGALRGVWEGLGAHARAQDAALKRIRDLEMQRAQLKDVAQEVRAERDVLQARMSEQALKISSLSARLQQQRNDAEALAQQAASQLTVQLHDTLAEVQRLKEELESRDKQIARMKSSMEEKDKLGEQHHSLYGNSCNPKDKVVILERELSSAQARIAQLEALARSADAENKQLQRALREKERQLEQLLAINLNENRNDDDNQKDDKSEVEGKMSARTLSDIVSISEFDDQDLQMRKAELKGHNVNLTGAPFDNNKSLNRTLPPELQRPNMSSLNVDCRDHFDFTAFSPRADSLPAHLTSTQNKDLLKEYKRNANEVTIFGNEKFADSVKNSTGVRDNCSVYPNRDVDVSKDVSVEPKKINFSLEATNDNRTTDEDEFTSLRELGVTLDIKQENFPDILTQLKHEIKKSRSELEKCKSDLKNAEEQLCEFPALKEEVEELKSLLENTMATMENDKKFYENQLENFSSNKTLLEQRLTELTQEVNDKSKDLHLLKEDILRRENMILELAKEKRNLTNKMVELEVKIDELQSRNNLLEKYENENHQMRDKISNLQKIEHLVSEKNQQIDSLNQHLDRLDDLQRNLTDKTEEFDNLKEAYEEKSNELEHLQDTVEALNKDIAKLNEDNNDLVTNNKELKLKLTKLEKEQENASIKLQNSETELERVNSLNNELTSKIEELKLLTDKLKDKETEIEILNEDINAFHEEIASLKEQLKMVSRSPSPRSKNGEEKSGEEKRSPRRQASNDKKQLVKIRKQISFLQHELDFNRKELNDKAFELAKAKLDVTELVSNMSQLQKQAAERDGQQAQQLQQLRAEREQLAAQLAAVVARIREESSLSELQLKLREKSEQCELLEREVADLRGLVDRLRSSSPLPQGDEQRALVVSGTRSPTAELERAVRDQLHYSHTLDEDIMDQILSASSDEREDVPRLALNLSKSSSSVQSSESERACRLKARADRLQLLVEQQEARLRDKDALIAELNRVRDKLLQDWQTSQLHLETEKDNSGRLQLLLETQKETSESLQNQDSNMIEILKKRLESAMQSELQLQQREQALRARVGQLERQLLAGGGNDNQQLRQQMEANERLQGEISLLKSKLEVERARYGDLQATMEHARQQARRELDAKGEACHALRAELAQLKRLKHECGVELVRAKELLGVQGATIAELRSKLAAGTRPRPAHTDITDALTEIESHKMDLAREISSLKKCLLQSAQPETRRGAEPCSPAPPAPLQGTDDREQAVRYLHGRCLRLESCRKALVWQKRYLQRVLAGYHELERSLRPPGGVEPSRGRHRFKCVATAVVGVLRMSFLVRRRQHVRALSAACVLRPRTHTDHYTPAPAHAPVHAPAARDGRHAATSFPSPLCTPPPRAAPAVAPAARRLLQHDLRLHTPANTSAGHTNMSPLTRPSPHAASPREEPFLLSSPRGEMAAAYLNKLDLVSRCLHHALDNTHARTHDAP